MNKVIVTMCAGAVLLGGCNRDAAPEKPKVPNSASCVQGFSPENLKTQEFAFDGVVAAVEADEIEFKVNTWFKGPSTDSMTVKAPIPLEAGSVTSTDFPSINKGDRYLVSGEGGFAHPCGFTKVYTADEASIWQSAFE
ncbi:MAG: hypothetical protein ABIS18_02410 [Actinomycetota bacterium]